MPEKMPEKCGFTWNNGWGDHICVNLDPNHDGVHWCNCDAQLRVEPKKEKESRD